MVVRDPYETFLLSLLEDTREMWEKSTKEKRREMISSRPEASWHDLGPEERLLLLEEGLASLPESANDDDPEVNEAILEGLHVARVKEWARRLNKEELLVKVEKHFYCIFMVYTGRAMRETE